MATTKTGGSGDRGKAAAAAGVPVGGTQTGGAPKSAAATKTGAMKTGGEKAGAMKTGAAKTGATTGAGTAKPAAAKSPGKAPAKRAATVQGAQPGRRDQMREFCSSRLGGWSHDEWERLLGDLRESGHDVSDPTAVGMELERERLTMVLEKVPGVGAPKAKSLVAHFGRLYDLRQASPDEIAQAAKLPRPLAERIVEAIR